MYSHCNSPTFNNILSALDHCNEWGLYYTGLVTFPYVVLLNQLNWFSIIFCLQSPDSRLFPEWLRNTSSQNWISPRFSSWKYILEFIEIHSFSAGKINFSGKKPNKNIFLTQPSPWFDSVKSNKLTDKQYLLQASEQAFKVTRYHFTQNSINTKLQWAGKRKFGCLATHV